MMIRLQMDNLLAGKRRARCLRGSLLVPFLLAAANGCFASPEHILASPPPSLRSLSQFGWAVADFDGDSQPDIAVTKMEARGGSYICRLELDLSTKRKTEAQPDLPSASSIFGLHLLPRDVDGDDKIDLIVTFGFTRQPVAVWINDGEGGFAEGDLSLYPGLTSVENLSIAGPQVSQTTLVPFDQGRRSRFSIVLGRGVWRPVLRSDLTTKQSDEAFVSRLCLGPAPARGPPSVL